MMTSSGCLCVGNIVADHVSEPLPYFLKAGSLMTTPRIQLSLGGCAANVAADLCRLGMPVRIAGAIGNDLTGKTVEVLLQQAGIDCGFLVRSETAQTSETLVVNIAGEDRRFIHCLGATSEYNGSLITREMLSLVKVIHVAGYGATALEPAEICRVFQLAREMKVITLLDVVLTDDRDYRDMLPAVLPFTDYFMPNNHEGEQLSGHKEPMMQAEHFLRLGCKTAVITRGSEGIVAIDNNQRLRLNAFEMPYVDGTGSGDAFVAGFIYGLLKHRSLRECLTLGSALGASCVRALGATTSVFTEPELLEYVSANKLREV
jgi:sugar/nucleoside kinase (ribokinase family)